VNEIANMAFVTGGTNRGISSRPPEKYLAEILDEQGPEALESHCIPLDSELWTLDAYPRFLEYRRTALAKTINEFIAGDERVGALLDVEALVASEEDENLEFKSSARWDYREGRPNKALEAGIVKTIAGFLNGKGGFLVIGVNDDGEVLGLETDYKTLGKRPDRDGYQQFLINVSSR
jgi:hypothetical protein